jgi:hypothetical protein
VEIPIRADYKRLLDAIDVSRGLIMHGNTDEAITLMRNMGSSVFSRSATTSVSPDDQTQQHIRPNPAADVIHLHPDVVSVRIVDQSGAVVLDASLTPDAAMLSVSSLSNGGYGALLRHRDGTIRHESLVIVR